MTDEDREHSAEAPPHGSMENSARHPSPHEPGDGLPFVLDFGLSALIFTLTCMALIVFYMLATAAFVVPVLILVDPRFIFVSLLLGVAGLFLRPRIGRLFRRLYGFYIRFEYRIRGLEAGQGEPATSPRASFFHRYVPDPWAMGYAFALARSLLRLSFIAMILIPVLFIIFAALI